MLLPVVDMNKSDMTCVNTILHFIIAHPKRNGAKPKLTCHQPLWFKASAVVESDGEDNGLHPIILELEELMQ